MNSLCEKDMKQVSSVMVAVIVCANDNYYI